MDVAASFQFLVDAFAGAWHVIAPDLRGFGRSDWQAQGYWFADYVADLDALVEHFAPGEPVDAGRATAWARTSSCTTRACDRSASRRWSRSTASAFPPRPRRRPRARSGAWLDALQRLPSFTPYASFEAVAARLMKNDPRLSPDKAAFLARHWAAGHADGTVRLTSDPRHKLPFPTVYRLEETFAIWRCIRARTLWVAAEDSHIPRWLNAHPEGEGATDSMAGVRKRMAHVPGATLAVVPDAGHMLHHDQPQAVARAIEGFLG